MCFTRQKENWDIKIAEEDIICYKLRSYFDSREYHSSYYRSFKYKFNKKYTLWFWNPTKSNIKKGFHSFINHPINNYYVCIIPKGSKYLANTVENEYVSNKIIITK